MMILEFFFSRSGAALDFSGRSLNFGLFGGALRKLAVLWEHVGTIVTTASTDS